MGGHPADDWPGGLMIDIGDLFDALR